MLTRREQLKAKDEIAEADAEADGRCKKPKGNAKAKAKAKGKAKAKAKGKSRNEQIIKPKDEEVPMDFSPENRGRKRKAKAKAVPPEPVIEVKDAAADDTEMDEIDEMETPRKQLFPDDGDAEVAKETKMQRLKRLSVAMAPDPAKAYMEAQAAFEAKPKRRAKAKAQPKKSPKKEKKEPKAQGHRFTQCQEGEGTPSQEEAGTIT